MKKSSVENNPTQSSENHENHSPTEDRLMEGIKKISMIALISYSFYKDRKLCVVFFAVGTFIGIFSKQKPVCCQGDTAPFCTQGHLAQVTDINIPAPVSFAVDFAILICHADHHKKVFVPIISGYIGAWFGAITSKKFKKINRQE